MNTDPRTSADDRIDAVLAQVAAAEPSAGMEERITRHLRTRQTRRATWTELVGAKLRTLASPAAYAFGAVAALAMALLFAHPHAPAPTSATAANSRSASVPAAPAPFTMTAERTPILQRHAALHNSIAGAHRPEQPSADAVAFAESRAASQPAPELPLTAEEHLLQRVTQHNEPVLLAQVAERSDQRGRKDALDSRAFFPAFESAPPATNSATADAQTSASPQQDNGDDHDLSPAQ